MSDPTPNAKAAEPDDLARPEALARFFHEWYEALAPAYGYKTRDESAVPWDDVPAQNRALMVAVASQVLHHPDSPVAALNGAPATTEDDDEPLCEECGELASLHPSDTPPVLNGAPATPAERAVIDAEREVLEQAMERPAPGSWQATRLSLAIDHLAGLRSERNKNDG